MMRARAAGEEFVLGEESGRPPVECGRRPRYAICLLRGGSRAPAQSLSPEGACDINSTGGWPGSSLATRSSPGGAVATEARLLARRQLSVATDVAVLAADNDVDGVL